MNGNHSQITVKFSVEKILFNLTFKNGHVVEVLQIVTNYPIFKIITKVTNMILIYLTSHEYLFCASLLPQVARNKYPGSNMAII